MCSSVGNRVPVANIFHVVSELNTTQKKTTGRWLPLTSLRDVLFDRNEVRFSLLDLRPPRLQPGILLDPPSAGCERATALATKRRQQMLIAVDAIATVLANGCKH
eukprot:6468822-Pyramimonas_sp.AAC.1